MRMRRGGEKIDNWVLRVTTNFENERECVYLFIFFRVRQMDEK